MALNRLSFSEHRLAVSAIRLSAAPLCLVCRSPAFPALWGWQWQWPRIPTIYMRRKIRMSRTDKFDTWNKRKFWLTQCPVTWVAWVKISVCFTFRIYPFETFDFFCSSIRGHWQSRLPRLCAHLPDVAAGVPAELGRRHRLLRLHADADRLRHHQPAVGADQCGVLLGQLVRRDPGQGPRLPPAVGSVPAPGRAADDGESELRTVLRMPASWRRWRLNVMILIVNSVLLWRRWWAMWLILSRFLSAFSECFMQRLLTGG